MQSRLTYASVERAALNALLNFSAYTEQCGLDQSLLDLVKIRASQINGCAYCLDMHTIDARISGETEQRLYMLDAWQESPFYTERERAALLWTETVTRVADTHVPDDVYEAVSAHFTPEELVKLTMAVIVINSWNRINVAFRTPPGHYKSTRQPETMGLASKG